jgi:hypothetical protein
VNALTLAELRLRHAQLTEKAERLRQEGRALSAVTKQATFLARRVRQYQRMADDYATLLTLCERTGE